MVSMVCFCQYQRELVSVVVVLNTEICTCCLQFLWGAVFFKNNLLFCFF